MAAVPFPDEATVLLAVPDRAEVELLHRGIRSAIEPSGGLSHVQSILINASCLAMTGIEVDVSGAEPIEPHEFALGLARRDQGFRMRVSQMMLLGAMVLRPLPPEVVARVGAFCAAMGVEDHLLVTLRDVAEGHLGLAAVDFERNGYTQGWSDDQCSVIHTAVSDPWQERPHDPELAARWQALESLPEGTLGHAVSRFYRARGFRYPGTPGSAPPLLAQHDWVHVLADYASTVDAELETFAFIARANDDPHGFSLLAMVVCLFETGYLASGAGLFQAAPGHLESQEMADRVADAMRRGALCTGSIDFMAVDWFAIAHLTIEEARAHFGVVAKSQRALAAGSVGPFDDGGMSPYQHAAGEALAAELGVPYSAWGATPARS